jgi:putative oxidoreductase
MASGKEGRRIGAIEIPGLRALLTGAPKTVSDGMSFEHPAIPLIGRLLIVYIFATSGIGKVFSWQANVQYMSTRHLPMIPVFLAIAAVIEIGGSICLVTGYRAREAAMIMFFYLIGVTVLFHNYWAASGMLAGAQETHFRKNLAIMGGLLMLAYAGPGRWVLSRSLMKRS